MPVGIGGGGFLGFAFEQLFPPLQTTISTASTGGTITAGTYRYLITTINANGESHGIADGGGTSGGTFYERSITTTGSTSTVTVSWTAVPGATGYKLYKTAAGGAIGSELLYKTVGVVATDIDTAPGSPTGAFPAVNTATQSGTYTAPTKYFPITNEGLNRSDNPIWRRDIRQNVDAYALVGGNVGVAGDLDFVATEDIVPYWLVTARTTLVRSGSSPNFTYTATPNANAQPTKTASITVVKNNAVFGYVGCIVSSYNIRTEDALLMMRVSILGTDEATQTLPVPTFAQTAAFGAGMYNVQIPTPTQVFTLDGFEFSVEDNGALEYRLKDTSRGAQFARFGARDAMLTYDADFFDKIEYDAYKALASTSVSVTATKGVNNSIAITMPAGYREEYSVALGGQGDLVRAHGVMRATFDNTTSRAYQIVCKTQESFVP
jgi:hypothetical protein